MSSQLLNILNVFELIKVSLIKNIKDITLGVTIRKEKNVNNLMEKILL